MAKRFRENRALENSLLTIVHWGVYLALFSPLLINSNFFFPFVGPKSLYFMALAEIIFFAYLALAISSSKYRPKFNLLYLALILFLFILILATVFGIDISRSFWSKFERMAGLLMMFHLFVFFIVLSSVFQKIEDWFKIFEVSILAANLVSLISLFDRVRGVTAATRGGATIGNTSFLGTYLLFNIFLAIYLLIKKRKGEKTYSIVSLALIGLALFLSDAIAATLSFLGGLVLLFFLYLIFVSQRKSLKILGTILLIASFIIFLISIFLFFQPNSFLRQEFIKLTTQARIVVWQGAWKGFLERPWLGWGPENFEIVFTRYFNSCMFLPECGGEVWFDRTHNIILDTLINSGIFGLLTYLGIFLLVFYVLWRAYFKKLTGFFEAGIFSVLLIAYFVQNLTVFDMINSYMMFFLVLGFVGSIGSRKEEFQPLTEFFHSNSWINGIIFILFIFTFLNFVVNPFKTDGYVIAALKVTNPAERLQFYKKALEKSPLGKYQIRDFFAQQTLETIYGEKAKEFSAENLKEELNFVSQELEKSLKESPLEFRSQLKLGQIYNAYPAIYDFSKISQAEEALKKAIELSPTNQQAYWSLAQTKLYQNQPEEALWLAEKAVELEPKVEQSHIILVKIAKIIGQSDLAQKKIEEAIKINPSWESELKSILGS